MASTLWRGGDEDEMAMTKSELALFAQRPVQTSIEQSHYVNVYPLNNVATSNGPIEFFIPGSAENYLDLDNTMLLLKVRVKLATGANLPGAATVFPVNNWMHTLFSDISLTLNETLIEGGTHMYGYKAYLSNLLLFGAETKNCQLQPSGFVKDEAGKMTDPAGTGFVARKTWITGSRQHQMIGPLHLDLFHQGKLILNQVDLRLKLSRQRPDFALFVSGADPPACRIDIEEAYLKVRHVVLAPNILRENELALAAQNAVYPIQRTQLYTYTITQGARSHVKENLFHGRLPKLIVLGLVRNEDFNGSTTTNPFTFRHCRMTQLGLYKDGAPVPQVPLSLDFPNSQFMEAYMNLMDSLNIATTDQEIGLTMTDYGNGYTLFGFNLSPDKTVAGYGQPLQDGNLRIEMRFGVALTHTINVIVMAIYDDEVQISRLRKVTVDYLA